MAVYTEVSEKEAKLLLHRLNLGELTSMRGIQGGIENTNYFVTSRQTPGDGGPCIETEYVLTIFERLTAEQLPFYLYLVKHLAQGGIPVPEPHADASGDLLQTLCGKPAAVVDKLAGHSELAPRQSHCAAVGDMLARMHLAGSSFERSQPNLRGLPWWNETAPMVLPYLNDEQARLLQSELAYQNHVAAGTVYAALPRGPIHADLFRDNVMFDGEVLTGFFDFYFAGVDTWLFDVAACLNDWCIDWTTGAHDAPRAQAFMQAYLAVRPLQAAERQLLPAMLRAGALRFWISRLWDFYLPREASLLTPHNPVHFEHVLRHRVQHPFQI